MDQIVGNGRPETVYGTPSDGQAVPHRMRSAVSTRPALPMACEKKLWRSLARVTIG